MPRPTTPTARASAHAPLATASPRKGERAAAHREMRAGLLLLPRLAAGAQVQPLQRRAAADPGERDEHAVGVQARVLAAIGLGRADGLLHEAGRARWQHRALRLRLRHVEAADQRGDGVELLGANGDPCRMGQPPPESDENGSEAAGMPSVLAHEHRRADASRGKRCAATARLAQG